MRWEFRRQEQTELYVLYSCFNGYSPVKWLIHWIPDHTTEVYIRDPEWTCTGGDSSEEEIRIFEECIVKGGFPGRLDYYGYDTRRAIDIYERRILPAISGIEQLWAKELDVAKNYLRKPQEMIAVLTGMYDEARRALLAPWIEFLKEEEKDAEDEDQDREAVLRRQPAVYAIHRTVQQADSLITERMRNLAELQWKMQGRLISFLTNPGSVLALLQEDHNNAGWHGLRNASETLPREAEGEIARAGQKETRTDSVNFTVLSPAAAAPDSYGEIELHMYTDGQREAVDRAVRDSDGIVKETTKGGFDIEREAAVTVRLESNDVEISDNQETQTWKGKNLRFDFQFLVPKDYERSRIAFTCYVECNGIPVTRLKILTVVAQASRADRLPARVIREDFRKAFISYSRKDESRMLSRVLGIRDVVPEMKFWLDRQSLNAGDLWREEIRKAISISDILLLFWSLAASQSPEVEKEWRYGLEQKGLSFIAPVPLDPPEVCPPPEALSELNFTVREFSRNDITDQLSFYSSDNIELI